MTDISIPVGSGGRPAANATSYNPLVGSSTAGNFPPGTPVAPSSAQSGAVVPANAHHAATSLCTGISTGSGVVGSRVLVINSGVVSLSVSEWNAVIQSGTGNGLTNGVAYFMASDFDAAAGRITTTAPDTVGDFVAPIGIGLSPTDLLVQVGTRTENT